MDILPLGDRPPVDPPNAAMTSSCRNLIRIYIRIQEWPIAASTRDCTAHDPAVRQGLNGTVVLPAVTDREMTNVNQAAGRSELP